ncbi:MAG: hypothetical protein FWG16_06995, partial [Micrococcales bacterium]|nr:hypothetical protein [Micrococcales bacterium]
MTRSTNNTGKPRRSRLVAAVTLIIVLPLIGLVSGSAGAEPAPTDSSQSQPASFAEPVLAAPPDAERLLPCIEFTEDGAEQAFSFDKYSEDLELMAWDLIEVIREYGGESAVAGVAYCSNYDGMAVFLPVGATSLRESLTVAAAKYRQFGFYLFDVLRTTEEMLALMDKLDFDWLEAGIVGFAPDIYTGGLVVTVLIDEGSVEQAVGAVTAAIGQDVPL